MKIKRLQSARVSLWLAVVALLALAAVLRPPVAHAANITVTAGEVAVLENGMCSLREAIINANDDAATHDDCAAGNGADVITLPAGSLFTLTDSYADYTGLTGLPQIDSAITVEGNGSTIDRDSATAFRFLSVASPGNLTVNNLTLTDGATTGDGGAIRQVSGIVTLNNSTLSGNSAAYGGGIFSSATITLNNSTLSGNSATNGGGGIYSVSVAPHTLNNSTLSGNSATNGGGIYAAGTMNFNRSLISGNTATNGHEIVRIPGSTFNANNYNVFGRSGIDDSAAYFSFTPGANDFNVTDNGTPTALNAILNTTLADNGGPTKTHALVAGSPAIDRGPSAACTLAPINGIDQRGYLRNTDGDSTPSANECDAGAFEYLSSPPPTTGDIVIVKQATPQTDAPFDFTEDIPGAASGFTLSDPSDPSETFDDVAPGSYTVTETGETGWTLDDITCVDPDNGSSDSGASATIDLDAGETVTCTFSNSRDTGTVVIQKEADPEDDTVFDFTENIHGGGGFFTLSDPSDNIEQFDDVPTGSYTINETAEPGWTLDDITCDDANSTGNTATGQATIDVEKDETVTCIFRNSKDAPPVYASAIGSGQTDDGLDFGPHDILRWQDGGGWSKWFDGDAAGLMPNGKKMHNINALWIPDTSGDDVVMSFTQNARFVPGITPKVDGMDLVWWNGATFSLWFDGQDVGLTNLTGEKIDALHVLDGSEAPPALATAAGGSCNAYLLISLQATGKVPNYSGGQINVSGEDVLGFCLTQSGSATMGKWIMVLDGSAQGMPKNSTMNLSASADGETLYLTTHAAFNVDAAMGGHSMIYQYDMAATTFSGPVWSARAEDMPAKIDGLQLE